VGNLHAVISVYFLNQKAFFRASMHRIPAREGIVSRMTTNSRLPPNT
jgi:hypothetical protein